MTRESAATREHHAHAPSTVTFAVVTVSDSRGAATDAGGDAAEERLRAGGHDVTAREWVRDDEPAIRAAVQALVARRDVHAVVVTGGTGAAPRDVTPEAVRPLFGKELTGFGELFRALSYREVGPAAMLSRATAGLVDGKPVFLLPGSPHGVTLAVDRLVAPEAGHLVGLAGAHREG